MTEVVERTLFPFDDPDIAEAHGVAVVLEIDGTGVGAFFDRRGAGVFGQLDAVLDDDAVVTDRYLGVLGFLALGVVFGGSVVDVVGLPRQGREAHVLIGIFDLVQSTAFVVLAGQRERIENLHFVAALQVTPAVGTPLTAGLGHVRGAEFQVQRAIAELLFAFHPLHQQAVVGHAAPFEFICRGAVEQDHRFSGRFQAERGALAFDLLEFTDFLAARVRQRQHAVFDYGGPGLCVDGHHAVFRLALTFFLGFLVPTIAGQAAHVESRVEFALPQGFNLHTDFAAFAFRRLISPVYSP